MQIAKAEYQQIESLRIEYLNSLPIFQELYLEWMVYDSEYYKLLYEDEMIGYAIKTDENTLVEFFLIDRYVSDCLTIFQTVIKVLTVAKVVCKSFDFLLLNCCLLHFNYYQLIGSSYRDLVQKEPFPANDLKFRIADELDLPFLLEQKDGLYETQKELEYCVRNRNIILFCKGTHLIGCGFLIKVHKNWDYYDIGMWVNPDFRKQGYATQIISHLKETCLNNGWIPIAGCAIDNVASQKTLEKNGFISKHKLIEFEVSVS